MADSEAGDNRTFVGIALVLVAAIAALAAFKFNVLNLQSWFFDDGTAEVPIPSPPDPPDPTPAPRGPAPFSPTPPDDAVYRVVRDRPLPERVAVLRRVGDYEVEINLRLVPQGWFVMGEDDGVRANMPKRWVWLDDYYLSETEVTNAQYYAFVLGNGYGLGQFWTPEGFDFMTVQGIRGTHLLGWLPISANRRLWRLRSPADEFTLEVLDADAHLGVPEATVVILPEPGDWHDFLSINRGTAEVSLRAGDTWRQANGEAVAADHRLRAAGLVRQTNLQGRVSLEGIRAAYQYTILAWPDGLGRNAILGDLSIEARDVNRGPNMPVVGMSWYEADAASRFFGGQLPTEAQWEKAARGTDGRRFPWGGELDLSRSTTADGIEMDLSPHANFRRARLSEVGAYPSGAGPWGHLDLVGNVSEWCRDVFYQEPRLDTANPVSTGGPGARRSERGINSNEDDALVARVYTRRFADPYTRNNLWRGFRIAMTPEQALAAR
jgi:formylglycine-generating enzyme required for sulfatase activity